MSDAVKASLSGRYLLKPEADKLESCVKQISQNYFETNCRMRNLFWEQGSNLHRLVLLSGFFNLQMNSNPLSSNPTE